MKTIAIFLGSVILITLIRSSNGLAQCPLKRQICGDICTWDCTCGGSELTDDKFCCIPSNASCTGIEYGEVNCTNGIAYDFDQPCGNECAISTPYNYVAISTTLLDNYECPKSDRFSKVPSGTDGSKDFDYCLSGETCGSSTSSVSFKQCYSKRSSNFNLDLGTVCLSRSDKPLFDKDTKSTTKGRKNLQSEIKNVTAEQLKLICHGQGEEYNWEDVCKFDFGGDSRPCQLKNGDILQLQPL